MKTCAAGPTTKAHTSVSAADIFGDGSVGLDRDEGEKKRLQVSYRNEVLGDIIDDYIESTKQRQVSGNRSDLTEPEKKEIFERYLSTLLNQVNPENFAVTNVYFIFIKDFNGFTTIIFVVKYMAKAKIIRRYLIFTGF